VVQEHNSNVTLATNCKADIKLCSQGYIPTSVFTNCVCCLYESRTGSNEILCDWVDTKSM